MVVGELLHNNWGAMPQQLLQVYWDVKMIVPNLYGKPRICFREGLMPSWTLQRLSGSPQTMSSLQRLTGQPPIKSSPQGLTGQPSNEEIAAKDDITAFTEDLPPKGKKAGSSIERHLEAVRAHPKKSFLQRWTKAATNQELTPELTPE